MRQGREDEIRLAEFFDEHVREGEGAVEPLGIQLAEIVEGLFSMTDEDNRLGERRRGCGGCRCGQLRQRHREKEDIEQWGKKTIHAAAFGISIGERQPCVLALSVSTWFRRLRKFHSQMNPTHVRRAIGGTSAFLGLCWLCMVIWIALRSLWGGQRNVGNYLFGLTLVPIMAIPAVVAIQYGIHLFQKASVSSLKWTMGLPAAFAALVIFFMHSDAFPRLLPKQLAGTAFLLLGSLLVMPAYFAALRFTLPYIGIDRPKPFSLIGRGPLALIAWEVWLLLSDIFRVYSPVDESHKDLPEEPGWLFLALIVPIVVAYGGYRLAAYLMLTMKLEQGDAVKESSVVI